ncbi:LTA synthase family protein [Oceanobacillus massiliensis]|uniref:LTA synthase family protein n=1 Tax=Oceanobacillus massiliensis TaxID=1465765 RepID=UPI000288D962|nr:LTA synthase family protein [Oceanobacillus massiliensis]
MIKNSFYIFYFIAVLFMWVKTYLTQLTQFELGVDNSLQSFLLFLNPLGSAFLFLGIAFLFKGKMKYKVLLITYFLCSFLLYANVLFYRFFNDFITLPTLTQTQNFGNVNGSIISLLKPYDFLMFLDFIILIMLVLLKVVKVDLRKFSFKQVGIVFLIGLSISGANLALANIDRPQLLTRGFDRNYIVKYLGIFNYTTYDAVQSTKASTKRVFADSDDITEIRNYTNAKYAEPTPQYFGVGEGMNIIYVHMESIQNFLIDYELHGEEVTPFLNSLTRDENTLYFKNFFHQTAQGKTADAEYMVANSLYGLPQGSAFTTKGLNTYHAAPAILSDVGYTSAVLHGNTGSFWNRDEIYKSLGYDKFYDSSYYEMDPDNLADYGLMDKPFFKESMDYLEALTQPFYANFITVTHHYPFTMDQEKATIEPHTTGNKTVDNYFQTARYADEALEQFFLDLKENDLFDNSIIIMYGDHYGISNNHNNAMKKVIGQEVTPFVSTQLQRTPLFIRVPGMEGNIMEQYAGQIDLLPTLLHILGIDSKDYIHFGTDMLSEQHDELVPFRNGDYVSPKYTGVDDRFYDSKTGEELIDDEQIKQAKKYRQLAEEELLLSDKVVNGDLLRFYTPEKFTPVDRTKYNYLKTTK